MKIGRIILAPLLALALLLTQIAPFMGGPAPVKRAQCGCHLAVCCCCQTPVKPNSAPQPAPPARAIAQDVQIVTAVVEQIFTSATSSWPFAFHARSSLEAGAIPLYQRDCVLLI